MDKEWHGLPIWAWIAIGIVGTYVFGAQHFKGKNNLPLGLLPDDTQNEMLQNELIMGHFPEGRAGYSRMYHQGSPGIRARVNGSYHG